MVTLLLRYVFAPGPLPVHTELLHYHGFKGVFFAGRTYGRRADTDRLQAEHRRLANYIVPDLDQDIARELVENIQRPKITPSKTATPPQLYIYAVASSAAGFLLHNTITARTAFVAYAEEWHTWTIAKSAIKLDANKFGYHSNTKYFITSWGFAIIASPKLSFFAIIAKANKGDNIHPIHDPVKRA